MRRVIIDLEATCEATRVPIETQEVIEIGAVILASANGPVVAEFSECVRPLVSPVLSEFCKSLTNIRQEDVDRARAFPDVFADLLKTIGDAEYRWASWGAFDLKLLRVECARHGITMPPAFESGYVNLAPLFAKHHGVRESSMTEAFRHLGWTLEGAHHRAIDDARNATRIAIALFGARAATFGE